MAVVLGDKSHFGASIEGVLKLFTVDATGDHRGHCGCTGNPQAGVVRDLAGLHYSMDEAFRLIDIAGDAHRGNTHGGAVGGAIAA